MRYEFHGFVVDPQSYRLTSNEEDVVLERRTFDLLCYLIAHRDRVVAKDELLTEVWGARVLSDGVLSNTVAKLRRALGQPAGAKEPIETVHGRGYRFRGALRELEAPLRAASSVPPAPAVIDPFVGREQLLKVLVQRLERPRGGSENVVVLAGEAGIGKTRTVRELSLRARERGIRVWIGAAHEGVGTPPYWPWTQILRAAHDDLAPEVWQQVLPPGSWAAAQLLPELFREPVVPPVCEPQRARFQLFDEVTRFFKAACAPGGLLVVLDDLHAADAASVELLRFAARALQEQPVTFVGTLRRGEPDEPQAVRAPMEELGRVATLIELDALTPEETHALASALSGRGPVDSQLAQALHSKTQGNPLFVRQALELLAQRGEFSAVNEALLGAELLPALRHVIRRRLAGLTEATRQVLEVAAVSGKTFDVPLLADVMQRTPEQVLDALEPASRLRLIERRPENAPEQFTFAHVLARDSLYADLGLRERGALHGRVASALARRGGARFLSDLAHHALRAVPFEVERAVEACRSAAAAAREASGFETAAELLMQALQKLEVEVGHTESRFRLLVELGENHFYAGSIASAWNAFRDAATVVQHAGRSDLLGEVAPRLVDCLEIGVGDVSLARQVIEQALAGVDAHAPVLRAALLAQRAEIGIELSVAERLAMLDEAAQLAEQSGVPGAVLDVAHSRAILRDPTTPAENAAAAEHLLQLMDRYPETAMGVRYRSLRRLGAYLTQYLSALSCCDVMTADAALERCSVIAQESHVKAAEFAVSLMRAGRALGDGRLAELAGMIPPLSPQERDIPSATEAWGNYLIALLEARDQLDAVAALDVDAFLNRPRAPARHALYVAIGRARIFARVGQRERARSVLTSIPRADLARMPVQYGDLGALCSLVDICQVLNDHTWAQELYDKLAPYAQRNAVGPSFEYRGAVAHFLGVLARLLGESARAEAHFLRAVAVNRKLGMALAAAQSERALA